MLIKNTYTFEFCGKTFTRNTKRIYTHAYAIRIKYLGDSAYPAHEFTREGYSSRQDLAQKAMDSLISYYLNTRQRYELIDSKIFEL